MEKLEITRTLIKNSKSRRVRSQEAHANYLVPLEVGVLMVVGADGDGIVGVFENSKLGAGVGGKVRCLSWCVEVVDGEIECL